MNIGIDIDNVISNFNEELLKEFLIHDKQLGGKGINPSGTDITRGMFDWPDEEVFQFYFHNIERIVKDLDVIEGAKEYIDQLKEDGHHIYIITGRDNGEYSDPYTITKEWLDQFSIYYDQLILTDTYQHDHHGKTRQCLEKHIDIMIDDSASICKDCIDHKITTLLMDTPYNRWEKEIPRVHNWKEIYDFICKYEK